MMLSEEEALKYQERLVERYAGLVIKRELLLIEETMIKKDLYRATTLEDIKKIKYDIMELYDKVEKSNVVLACFKSAIMAINGIMGNDPLNIERDIDIYNIGGHRDDDTQEGENDNEEEGSEKD